MEKKEVQTENAQFEGHTKSNAEQMRGTGRKKNLSTTKKESSKEKGGLKEKGKWSIGNKSRGPFGPFCGEGGPKRVN